MNWLSLYEGSMLACPDCVVGRIRETLTNFRDAFTEDDISTPQKALAFMNALDDKDGDPTPPELYSWVDPASGQECSYCKVAVA